jgi:hypothetical protein
MTLSFVRRKDRLGYWHLYPATKRDFDLAYHCAPSSVKFVLCTTVNRLCIPENDWHACCESVAGAHGWIVCTIEDLDTQASPKS